MIGNYIKGTDLNGHAVEGIIIDSVIAAVPFAVRQGIGQQQVVPMPLTAYLVQNMDNNSIHLVPPMTITAVGYMNEDQDLENERDNAYANTV
jgi:hypothetical protein